MAPRSWIALLVAGAALAVYFQVCTHEFVYWDDQIYIFQNEALLEGLTAAGIAHDFSSTVSANWHPLTMLSLRIDHALYGLDAAGYLLTNAVLHAFASAILYLALARMTRAPGRSAFVAAVFALHPLHVESVAWASERKDVLSGVFFALLLLAYARHAEKPSPRRMAIVGSSLLLGLLSKSVLVTVPCVLLLLDYWPLRRLQRGDGSAIPDRRRLLAAVVEKWPLFALVAAAAVATWAVQDALGATAFWELLPLGTRVANAIHSYGMYLADSFWPTGLAMFYPHPDRDIPIFEVALAAAALTAITTAALSAAASRPYLIVGWLWFLGMLVPMIGLVQVGEQARADRYMYLPLIGLAIAVAWGVHGAVRGRNGRRALVAAAVIAVSALAVRSWDQIGKWRDSRTLFEHAIAVTERNATVHVALGGALQNDGLYDAAAAQYAIATEIAPRSVRAHLALASALVEMGDLEGAVASFERVLRIQPGLTDVRGDLAVTLVMLGRVEEGMQGIEHLIAEGEANAGVYAFLANRSFVAGRANEAAHYYRETLRLDASHSAATNNLAWLLATSRDPKLRNPDEAVVYAERGARRDPSDPGVLDTLAAAYAAAERYGDAVRAASKARALVPDGSPSAAEFDARIELYRSGRALFE